jgi:hypothetical protein
MERTGWSWLALTVWAAACGGQALEDDTSEGGEAQAGEAGEGVSERPEAGAGGTANGEQPQPGGRGGAAEAALRAVTEAGLIEQDVENDEAVLAGMSFTLEGSLCPVAWPLGEGGAAPDAPVAKEIPMPTLHLRAAAGGGLEAVTYTAAGGEPQVQVSPMRRSGLGWILSDVATCANAIYVFEDEWETIRYTAGLLHVVFVRGRTDAPLQVVVAASHKDGPLLGTAQLDVVPPAYDEIDLTGYDTLDGYFRGYRKDFVFSEPMSPSTQVQISEGGAQATIEYRTSAGYVVGFRVDDVLGTGYVVETVGTDLAGHAVPSGTPYPGLDLGIADGSFEGPVDFITSDDYSGLSIPSQCWHAGPATSSKTDHFGPTLTAVPPLAGAQSFLFGDSHGCWVGLRLVRDPGHEQLRFEARVIGNWRPEVATQIQVCVSSLGIGEDSACHDLEPAWIEDSAYEGSPERVSQVTTLAVPLETDATNLLVEITTTRGVSGTSDNYLWMDSLRSE